MTDAQTVIDKAIAGARRELRSALVARLLIRSLALILLAFAIGYTVDRWLEPPQAVRLVGEAALVGVFAIVVVRGLIAASASIPEAAIADALGRRLPSGSETLLAAISRSGGEEDDPLLNRTKERAAEQLRDATAEPLCKPAWQGGAGLVAIVLTPLLLGLAASSPAHAWTYAKRLLLADARYPRSVRLVIDHAGLMEAGSETLIHTPVGEPVEVVVRADLTTPYQPPGRVSAWIDGAAGGRRQGFVKIGEPTDWFDERMGQTIRSQRYRLRLELVNKEASVWIRGGDCRLPSLRLIGADRPAIVGAAVYVQPPEYLQAEPYTASLAELNELAEGSLAVARLTASRELSSAVASVDASHSRTESVAIAVDGALATTSEFDLREDTTLSVQATDTLGLSLDHPYEIALPVRADQPPTAALQTIGISDRVTPNAIVPLRLQADDDHAIAKMQLLLRIGADAVTASDSAGQSDEMIDLPTSASGRASIGSNFDLDLERSVLGSIELGSQLQLRLMVSDAYDLGQRAPSESEPLTLRIVSAGEVLALLGDREARVGEELSRLAEDLGRLSYRLSRQSNLQESDALRFASETDRVVEGVDRAIASVDALVVEAQNNRLDQPSLVSRWRTQVITPLRAVQDTHLSETARLLQDGGDADALAQASRQADAASQALRQVAALIAERESYQQLVSQLRALLREQRRINQLTTEEQRAVGTRLLFD